jgi:hypothetical protein
MALACSLFADDSIDSKMERKYTFYYTWVGLSILISGLILLGIGVLLMTSFLPQMKWLHYTAMIIWCFLIIHLSFRADKKYRFLKKIDGK